MTSVVIYPPWKGAATLAVNSASRVSHSSQYPLTIACTLPESVCAPLLLFPHRATGPLVPPHSQVAAPFLFLRASCSQFFFVWCGWEGGGGGVVGFFFWLGWLGGWVGVWVGGVVVFFCFVSFAVGVRGWWGCCVFLFFSSLAFAVLVAVAGCCGGCPGLPVVVWWLLSRGVVGCVVWLVVFLRCFAAPFFVVVALCRRCSRCSSSPLLLLLLLLLSLPLLLLLLAVLLLFAVAGVVGPLLLLLLAAAAFLLARTFPPAPAKLRPHFRSACHRPPTLTILS